MTAADVGCTVTLLLEDAAVAALFEPSKSAAAVEVAEAFGSIRPTGACSDVGGLYPRGKGGALAVCAMEVVKGSEFVGPAFIAPPPSSVEGRAVDLVRPAFV